MKSRKQLLAIAKRQIGNNGAKYRKYVGAGGSWCNMYAYWLFDANGCGSLFPMKTMIQKTYCPSSIDWCRKHLAQIPPYIAMACDLIYFDWEKNGRPNHIGIVEKKVSTERIDTIEGNTSGGIVDDKKRATGYVQAVFRTHFKAEYRLGVLVIDGDFGDSSVANLQKALGIKVTGILNKDTVRAIQRLCGATEDGHWGSDTSKKLQRFLHKKGFTCKIDGQWGEESTKALQRWINDENKVVIVAPDTPVDPPKQEKYPGKFPELPPKTAKIAVECAYPYGTPLKKYKYEGGKPKPEYKEKLNKAYPKRSHWKYPKSRAGASCDVFAGTVLKLAGYKSAPHTMSTMVAWCRKHLKKVSSLQNGDILTRTNHVMVVVDIRGKKRVANAHFLDHGGTYGIIEKIGKHTDIWRPEGDSCFSLGDTFTDVKKLKKYLNWYGNYGLKITYDFDPATEIAVMDFQAKEGLPVTGEFGAEELKAAKAVTK